MHLRIAPVLFAFLLLFLSAEAQSIQSEVISCFGAENILGNTGFIISATCGEAVAESAVSGPLNFHSGFQQGMPSSITSAPWISSANKLVWQIYPNPGTGLFQVHQINPDLNFRTSDYRILDSRGRLIQTGVVSKQESSIFMNEPAAGLYFLQIISQAEHPVCLPFVVAQ